MNPLRRPSPRGGNGGRPVQEHGFSDSEGEDRVRTEEWTALMAIDMGTLGTRGDGSANRAMGVAGLTNHGAGALALHAASVPGIESWEYHSVGVASNGYVHRSFDRHGEPASHEPAAIAFDHHDLDVYAFLCPHHEPS